MYTDNRATYRLMFASAWQKHLQKQPLTSLEQQIVAVIAHHPEYHHLITASNTMKTEFALEENPFFHMSMHIAILEQLQMDRPQGICALFQQLLINHPQHQAEHILLDCLAATMWQAQQSGLPADEKDYLLRIKQKLAQE